MFGSPFSQRGIQWILSLEHVDDDGSDDDDDDVRVPL